MQSYTIKLSNAAGDLYETTKMLTGTSYTVGDNVVIALPKNATVGDVTVSVTLKNGGNASVTESVVLQNVKVPVFEKLYLLLGSKVCEMEKDENGVFIYDDLISAGATGKIYVNSDKTGMFWGNDSGSAVPMADGEFAIGGTENAALKVSFNPVTFEIQIGEGSDHWTEIDEPIYILGDISGHAWETGEIVAEGPSTKMQGYQSGNKKYWTWTPPATGDDSPNDWWGNIQANPFRFKKGNQYILYRDHTIKLENGDDKNAAFATSVGGHVNIKVFFDGATYNKVSIEVIDWEGNILKNLDYLLDGKFNINGSPAPEAITFAGSSLSLKEGTFYVYEGTANLTKGQDILAQGTNLSAANPDPDVFSGKGLTTWKMVGNNGQYVIRIDPFASTIYACQLGGYEDAIYMDGWS